MENRRNHQNKQRSSSPDTGAGKDPSFKKAKGPKVDAPHVLMDEYKQEVIESIKKNASAVIIGETGSGKTTRIPVYLLEAFPGAKIAITQPRRVAARSVARYVAEQRGEQIGGEVGYQVRFEDQTTKGTRANFMTDGILLRKLQFDPLLKEFDIVMVDEAHERSLNIDFILGLLKRTQAERIKNGLPELKVVATSATIEKEKFANFFGHAPIVEVPGRMYPVEVKYAKNYVKDYTEEAAHVVKLIADSGKSGDVLIFMPGEAEIRRTIRLIEELNLPNIDAMPLFGAMAPEDQDRIFAKNPKRKIIVSTNIAETSLTIDGVTFVVDSGVIKQTEFDPHTGIEALLENNHAKSGCEQRKGRAGRTAPGTCYRLYTENDYNDRQPFQKPEIARSNLDHVILAMKKIGIDKVREFDFIDKPKESTFAQAIETLQTLGALDENEQITEIGETMADLPLRPELARMVIEAEKYGCTGSIITIAAMFGNRSASARSKNTENKSNQSDTENEPVTSDFLTLLEVWKQWSRYGFRGRRKEDFREVIETRQQLMRTLERKGIVTIDSDATQENIEKSVVSGLIQNLLYRYNDYYYKRIDGKNEKQILIHPSSVAFHAKPRMMIGAKVVTTTKTFARMCQPVKLEWLPEIAPQLLKVNSRRSFYNQETDQVEELVSYSFRGQYSEIIAVSSKITDPEVATDKFVEALVDGYVDVPFAQHNKETQQVLQNLYQRSGGRVIIPDMTLFYKERLGGMSSKDHALYISKNLTLNFADYCSPELLQEIEQKYPDHIKIGDRKIAISYEYKPADPKSYYADDHKEKFQATVDIPFGLLSVIDSSNAPKIGAEGRPVIVYKSSKDYYNNFSENSLDQLKMAANEQFVKGVWDNFSRPDFITVEEEYFVPLPSLASYNLKPRVYGKDLFGNNLVAYPGYEVSQSFHYREHGEQKKFRYQINYFKSEAEATASTEAAMAQKESVDAEKKRLAQSREMAEPARKHRAEMEPKMRDVFDNLSKYSLQGQAHTLSQDWQRTNSLIHGLNGHPQDPVLALEIMAEIARKVAVGEKELNKRLAMIEAIKEDYKAIEAKFKKFSGTPREHYGMTYKQHDQIRDKWTALKVAIETEDRYGKFVMPDPEKALELMLEIEASIPEEMEFTPEQESLMETMTGRDSGFTKLIRVKGGRVTECVDPKHPDYEVVSNPTSIDIGRSGRHLAINGRKVTFVFGGGSSGDQFVLSDGEYVFGRDAYPVIRVESTKGALKAIEFVTPLQRELAPDSDLWYAEPPPIVYGDNSADTSLGGLGDLLKGRGKKGGQKEEKPPKEQKPPRRVFKVIDNDTSLEDFKAMGQEKAEEKEREQITEELRAELTEMLRKARVFVDVVRAAQVPSNKKDPNFNNISKLIVRANTARDSINELRRDLTTATDAPRFRGNIGAAARSAEKMATEMAKLLNERTDWTERYDVFARRIKDLAEALEVEIDSTLEGKIRPLIIQLAKEKDEEIDFDGELETILVDNI